MVESGTTPRQIAYRQPPDGGWELATGRAAPHLRSLVRGYEGYREAMARPMRRRELPAASIPVIFNLGAPYRLLDPAAPDDPARAIEQRGGFVAGLDDSFSLTESTGAAHCLQIDLAPLAAYRLFGRPLSEIARRVVPLEELFGQHAGLLLEQLAESPAWEKRFDLLDATIADRLARAPSPASEIVWAWQQLVRSGGRMPIGTLVEELGWSPKRLIARFREEVGLPPKQTARLLRFQRAVGLLRASEAPDWCAFAQQAGYADQSHLIHEFRQFAGATPQGIARLRLPADGGFAAN